MKVTDKIQIINGDSLDLLENFKVDCIFTSPPYNSKRFKKYENFKDEYDNYFNFLVELTDKALKSTNLLILNIQSNYYNREDVNKFIGYYHSSIKRQVMWIKDKSFTPSSQVNRLTNCYEYFFIITNGESVKCNSKFCKDIFIYDVLECNKPKNHNAVMRLGVADFFIKEFTQQNDVVLDIFSGLATTGIACFNNNRQFIGIELDKEYYEASIKRIKNHISQQRLF